MPVSNPSGNNPLSGTATALGGIQKTVTFPTPFAEKPNVVISPWGDYNVWLTTITVNRFKFLNDSSEEVKIDWIADQR